MIGSCTNGRTYKKLWSARTNAKQQKYLLSVLRSIAKGKPKKTLWHHEFRTYCIFVTDNWRELENKHNRNFTKWKNKRAYCNLGKKFISSAQISKQIQIHAVANYGVNQTHLNCEIWWLPLHHHRIQRWGYLSKRVARSVQESKQFRKTPCLAKRQQNIAEPAQCFIDHFFCAKTTPWCALQNVGS